MKKKIEIRLILLIGAALAMLLAACSQAPAAPETGGGEVAATSAPESGAQATQVDVNGYPVPESGEPGAISLVGNDACSYLAQEQVEAAFGKPVIAVNPDTQSIGSGCEYVFDADTQTQVQISIYEGDAAKSYFAGLTEALQESCDAFAQKIFDINFLTSPTSSQDVSGIPLGDLYTTYVGVLGNCAFVQNGQRADVGENVVTAETIYLNWSSDVAVLGDDRVVEFKYQEPISADAQADFQNTTDKDSFYAAAQPYRDSVLANYTETLIGLLQQATAQ